MTSLEVAPDLVTLGSNGQQAVLILGVPYLSKWKPMRVAVVRRKERKVYTLMHLSVDILKMRFSSSAMNR